jgi:biopolymer transport protein ExbB
MIKAFGALAAAELQIKQHLQRLKHLIPQQVWNFSVAIISYNFFTSKIDDLTYSIDAAVSIVNSYRRFRGSLKQ